MWLQVLCDLVLAGLDAGIWQRVVLPTLSEATLSAINSLTGRKAALSPGKYGRLAASFPPAPAQPVQRATVALYTF